MYAVYNHAKVQSNINDLRKGDIKPVNINIFCYYYIYVYYGIINNSSERSTTSLCRHKVD